MAGFAFLFAPILFAHIGPSAPFAATIAACVRALASLGDWLGIVAVIITVTARLESRRSAAFIVASVALAMVAGFLETSLVVPRMETTPLLTPAYAALHRTSSGVYAVALLAALAAFVRALLTHRRWCEDVLTGPRSGLPYRSRL